MARRLAAIDDRRVSVLPGTSDFRNVIAALRHLQAVISPDTAVVHAAACTKTPVVVMYSLKASFLNEWMPHAVPYEAVFTDGRLDLETIRPDAVVDAYERLRQRVPVRSVTAVNHGASSAP